MWTLTGLGCSPPPGTAIPRGSAVAALRGLDATSNDAGGFALALTARDFVFPADHGPHPQFAVEWWYFTGNLASASGRQFGFQLTFFRRALAPPLSPGTPARASAWASRQIYLAHFALADLDGGAFHAAERMRRDALDLAGAHAAPFTVWLEDWQATSQTTTGMFPLRLVAEANDAAGDRFAVDLILDAGKPIVLHGDRGLSRKGARPGNASYYYSRTRMPTVGTVGIDPGTQDLEQLSVTGASWLDREWSTNVLEPEQVGWDWFSLQLDDRRELMVFELRRRDGTIDPASHGTLIVADGTSRPLASTDFSLEILDHWRSLFGTIYPARWRLLVPSAELDLIIIPALANQELDLSFRYWEGSVQAVDPSNPSIPIGQGYAELVGYSESNLGAAPASR
jgi:predicted secreted hydrolase